MIKLFIVEDDETIATLIEESLNQKGYSALRCRDFSDVTGEEQRFGADLVLMDISLPFHNGFFWCNQIRSISNVPVVFLTSHTDDIDIITAMNIGADDYLTKPFSMEVLTAKVNAVLRRSGKMYQAQYVIGDTHLNLSEGVLCFDSEKVELTKNEIRILKKLLDNRNEIVPREDIMRALWDDESFVDDNTLTVNINRLRTKLAQAGIEDCIKTKKGLGYMIHD